MMHIVRSLVAVSTVSTVAIMVFTSRIAGGQPPPPPPLEFIGVPRDIDFVKLAGWTQVVLHAGPADELISQARSDGIVRIVLLALMLRRPAAVQYVDAKSGPQRLVSAALELHPNGELLRVQMLSFDERDNYCRATIVTEKNNTVAVWTKNRQVQGILETAAREAIPVQNFDFDPETMEITRAKVNVELPEK